MMTKKLQAIYGLKWPPFATDVPDESLWVTPALEHFARRVEQQVSQGGFALITGDPGTGKSASLRWLAHRLGGLSDVSLAVLIRPQSRLADFYRELGELFGVLLVPHNRWGGFKALRDKWQAHVAATLRRPLLLIDEAQEMPLEVFSELRLLSSTHFDSRSILTVVLCGDGRLLELLRKPELLPIGSRVRVRLNLDYASAEELAGFLTHRLEQAGNPNLMTPALIHTLSEHAAGNYRVLCSLAEDLLAAAVDRELAQLDEKLFLEVFAPSGKARGRAVAAVRKVGP